MSPAANRAEKHISIFPFLAVLVCTMGALILLLLVTTHRVRQEAITRAYLAHQARLEAAREAERAAAEPTPEPAAPEVTAADDPESRPLDPLFAPEPLPDPDAPVRAVISRLQARRQSTKAALVDARRAAESARARNAEVEKELEQLKAQLASLDLEQSDRLAHQRELEHARLEIDEKIRQTEAALGRVRKQAVAASSKYAVIPYDGDSGTTRRPVYIECTERGFRFLPEDVMITPRDLKGFTPAFNPLLAGTRAMLSFWNGRRLQEGSDEPEPYVLLLVRPSGSAAFYAAQQLLTSLRSPFGYELIDESQEIALASCDPAARDALQAAIDKALASRNPDIANKTVDDESFIPAEKSTLGEFGTSTHGGNGPGDDAGMPGEGRGPGAGSTVGNAEISIGGAANTAGIRGGAGDGSTLPSPLVSQEGARGGPSDVDDALPSPLVPLPRGGAANGAHAGGKPSNGIGHGRPGGIPSTVRGVEAPDGIATFGAIAGKPPTTGRGGPGNGGAVAGPNGAHVSTGSVPGGPRPANPAAGTGRSTSAASSAGERAADNPFAISDNEFDPLLLSADALEELENTPEGASSPIGSAASPVNNGQSADQEASSAGTTVDPDDTFVVHPPTAPRASARPQAPDDEDSSLPEFGVGQRASTEKERPSGTPHKWGAASPYAYLGMKRKMVIHVAADRFTIDGATLRVREEQSSAELTARVLRAMEMQVAAWEAPPEKFYWVPTVKFHVSPGGIANYTRVNEALKRRGVKSTVEFEAEPTKTKYDLVPLEKSHVAPSPQR